MTVPPIDRAMDRGGIYLGSQFSGSTVQRLEKHEDNREPLNREPDNLSNHSRRMIAFTRVGWDIRPQPTKRIMA
jgi:hypothetical protein